MDAPKWKSPSCQASNCFLLGVAEVSWMSKDSVSPHVWTRKRGFGPAMQPCHLLNCHLWCLSRPFSEGIWVIRSAEIFLGCWRKFFFYLMSQTRLMLRQRWMEHGLVCRKGRGLLSMNMMVTASFSVCYVSSAGLCSLAPMWAAHKLPLYLLILFLHDCVNLFFRNFHWTLTSMRVFSVLCCICLMPTVCTLKLDGNLM